MRLLSVIMLVHGPAALVLSTAYLWGTCGWCGGLLRERDVSVESLRVPEALTRRPPPQAIALLDTLDKDVNTFIMRVREWYGWHFPELAKVVADNFQYARVVMFARDKASLGDDSVDGLAEITGDREVAEQVPPFAARAGASRALRASDPTPAHALGARRSWRRPKRAWAKTYRPWTSPTLSSLQSASSRSRSTARSSTPTSSSACTPWRPTSRRLSER